MQILELIPSFWEREIESNFTKKLGMHLGIIKCLLQVKYYVERALLSQFIYIQLEEEKNIINHGKFDLMY